MKKEYDEYFHFGSKRGFLGIPYTDAQFKPERDKLAEKFYQKYHGMSKEEYEAARQEQVRKTGGFYPGANNPAESLKNTFEGLSVPGLAWADFFMDAAGTVVPGMDKVDDRWDEATQLDNPLFQNTRRVLSIVLPAIKTGGMTSQFLTAKGVNSYPWIAKWLTRIGAYSLADGTVALLSDTSEDHNAAKTVSDLVPGMFGPKGFLPIPEAWKTKESQSPAARKMMNFYENSVLSTVGTILGAFIDAKSAVKKSTDFIEPLDEASAQYKRVETLKASEPDLLIEMQDLNTKLSAGNLNRQVENQLVNRLLEIEDQLGITTGVEGAVRR